MAVAFVQSNQVLEVNSEIFGWPNYPNGISKLIPSRVSVINSFWRIPKTLGNRVIGYDYLVALDATKPTPDSVKMLRVKDPEDNTEYGFAITDGDHFASSPPTDEFADLCNGLGGDLPVMPTVTIPTPIMQSAAQSTNSDGDKTFIFAFPANGNAREYAIPYPWFNGVAPSQAYEPSGITTPAQFVTWANTGGKWDGFGTWSNPSGNVIQLISTTTDDIYVENAGMQVALTPANYCLTLNATPDAVNGIKIDNAFYTFPAFYAGRANRNDLINAIKKFFPLGVFSTSVTNKINVLTTQLPQAITNDEATVSGLTWSSGVCS